MTHPITVMPAKAGIQSAQEKYSIPASAGMPDVTC
jgi:hypothetical protein